MSEERLDRALLSLDGLSVADSLGGFFEMSTRLSEPARLQQVPQAPWHWTDDTLMALSIVEVLRKYETINQAALAHSFAWHFERARGYGQSTRALLKELREGASWHEAAYQVHAGEGSWGNGSAMRVAPLGAYFADDLQHVVTEAERSAVVTHTHPEAVAGAIAVALAAAWAWKLRDTHPPVAADFIDLLIPQIPASEVRSGLLEARELPHGTLPEIAARKLGNGAQVSCPDTVPLAIWLAASYFDNYPQAIWAAIRSLGDTDTTAAIAGGIIVLFSGAEAIPNAWLAAREALPTWALQG